MAPPRTRAAQGRHGGYIPSDFSTQKNTRARALAFRARGHSRKQTAQAFGVSCRTISRWQRMLRTTGSLSPQLHRTGRKRKLNKQDEAKLRQLLEENPFLTDAQLAQQLGGKISRRKTKSYLRRLRKIPIRDRVYVDETYLYANAYPGRGRAMPSVHESARTPPHTCTALHSVLGHHR